MTTMEKNHVVARTLLSVALAIGGLLIFLYLVRQAVVFWLMSSGRM